MPSDLSEKQIKALKNQLNHRFFELRGEIRQELLASDDEQYSDLAGQVHDAEDESVADLLVDVKLAMIDQHVQEVREIDAALLRIAKGVYGNCIDCNDRIDHDRLRVQPSAQRCHICQVNHELNYVQRGHSSL